MDKKKVIEWVVAALARALAWVFAAKLGMEATEADSVGIGIAEAVGALVLAGFAIYSSVKGRRRLLATDPNAPPGSDG